MSEWWKNLNKTDVRNVLSVLTLMSVIMLIFILLFYPIPQRNVDLVNVAMGYLMGQALGGVFGYYFGSSKNEVDKDAAHKNGS